jgi:TonB family protein
MLNIHINDTVWLQFLFDMTVRGTLIVAVAVAAVALWKSTSAATKHYLLTVALLGALVAPLALVALGSANIVPPVQVRTIQALQLVSGIGAAAAGSGSVRVWLVAIWLAGAALVMLSMTAAFWRTRRILKHAVPAESGSMLILLDACRREIGVKKQVRLLFTDRTSGPFTYGWLKPSLVLPADSVNWSTDRQRYFLLHELAHVKRRDTALAPLTFLAAGFHWFNPLIWKCLDLIYLEREKACDDYVMASGVVAAEYADELAGFAQSIRKRNSYFPPGMAMTRRPFLVKRISSILTYRNHAPFLKPSTAIAMTAVMCAVIVSLQCTETPIFPDKQKGAASQAVDPRQSGVPVPQEFTRVDEQPEMIEQVNPEYPAEAKAAGTEGVVWVQVYVDSLGNVQQARAAKTSGSTLLDDAAVKASWKSKFTPAKKDGKPVPVWVTYKIVFKLMDKTGASNQ